MKKLTKLTSLLLAGIMALAMLTACGGTGNDAATAEFEGKVEQAYMTKLNEELNKKFKNYVAIKEFKNDDAIKNLAVKHIEAMAGKETLSMDELWAEEKLTEKTQNWVMICYDVSQSNGKAYVKSSYEAGKAETITPDETTIDAFLNLARMKAHAGNTAKFTALGVGVKTINGKTYPRPVETKILGVPVPGQRIEGSSTLLGGEDTDLSSKWLISDSADGDYHFFRIRRSYAVPSYLAGKYIKFVSTDRNGNQDASIPYKVLRSAEIAGTTNDAELLRAASKGYIDENDALDLNRPITKRECAKMLGKLWNLTAPSAPVTISDIPASDPDYGVIAAVVEAGMIELKDPTSAIAQGTLYNAGVTSSEGAKRTAFLPDATIDRDEMGHIALLSCGVPYNETLGTQPKFDDASQIESVYEDNVGASAYFGFVTAKTGNSYLPKEKTTLEDLIRIVERISDFNNK